MPNNPSVTILEVLKGTTGEAKDWVDALRKRQINGFQYSWVLKFDSFLKHLPPIK